MKLIQKKLFTKRVIELKEESIFYKEKRILNQFIETEIPYEDLRINRNYKHSRIPIEWLLVTALIGFFFFATLISKSLIPQTKADWEIIIILGIVFFILSFISYSNWINETYIVTINCDLALYRTKSNSKDVDNFILQLNSKAKSHVLEKYMEPFDRNKDDFSERLRWLYENGFILKKEYEKFTT